MTHETLRHLREKRGLTREQLAEWLGDCSASTVNKWERDINPVPAWVEEKMMRSIPVTLPLDELHLLLTEAQLTGQSPDTLLAEAIRLWLKSKRPAEIIPIGPRQPVQYQSTPCGIGGSAPERRIAEEHDKDNNEP